MKGIRGLALAALAAGALAMLPATASASAGISANKYPTTLHGHSVGELQLSGSSGLSLTCGEASFDASLEAQSETVLTSSLTDPVCGPETHKIEMNGCQLELDPGGVQTVAIGPPGCGPIVFSVGLGPCTIPAQTGISATYETIHGESETHFNVAIADSGVEYTSSGSGCGRAKGTYNDLSITGEFAAFSDTGSTAAVTGGLGVGGGLEGGQFKAPDYPVQVTGERLSSSPFDSEIVLLDAGLTSSVTCDVAEFDGGELSQAVSSLSLDSSYSECVFGRASATVNMNSCHYEYSGLEYVDEGEYEGSAEIACNEGDAITISAAGCTLTIPPQTLGGGETLFGNFDIADEAVLLGLTTASGIEFTSNGKLGCKIAGLSKGAYENGSSESGMLLRGDF